MLGRHAMRWTLVGMGMIAGALGCGGKVFVDVPTGGTGGTGAGVGGSANGGAGVGGFGAANTSGGGGAVCPAGTCKLDANGDCEAPGGPKGNGCCQCGSDGFCSAFCECAAPDTAIATPDGERSIASLRAGDLVYSVEGMQVVAVPIAMTHQNAVSSAHTVMRVKLANGTTLEISKGHPTLDGRTFRELAAGGELGGVGIVEASEVGYSYDRTYDILPASESGGYFAGGVLIGSTMKPNARVEVRAAKR